MLDANGRPLLVGDYVTLAGTDRSIVSQVIKAFGDSFVELDNDLVFHDFEVESWGGYEWITCQECGFSRPFDVRMNASEECPHCDAIFHVSQVTTLIEEQS